MGILLLRHFDVRMTSYTNFFVDFGFRIQKYPPTPNLSKIKPISWQICKFLHFSVLRHIHNKRLPWQHLRLMRIVIMCKMTPIRVRLNLKNFILISCAVLELLRKVSQGAESAPRGEIGLTDLFIHSKASVILNPLKADMRHLFLRIMCRLSNFVSYLLGIFALTLSTIIQYSPSPSNVLTLNRPGLLQIGMAEGGGGLTGCSL